MGKQLLVEGDARFPSLSTLTVEPSFLASVAAGQSDTTDKEMVRLCSRGRSNDAQYTFRDCGGFSLLYRVARSGVLQLVIPKSRGLRELLMHELHCIPTAAHLGAHKVIAALTARVYWPCLA